MYSATSSGLDCLQLADQLAAELGVEAHEDLGRAVDAVRLRVGGDQRRPSDSLRSPIISAICRAAAWEAPAHQAVGDGPGDGVRVGQGSPVGVRSGGLTARPPAGSCAEPLEPVAAGVADRAPRTREREKDEGRQRRPEAVAVTRCSMARRL